MTPLPREGFDPKELEPGEVGYVDYFDRHIVLTSASKIKVRAVRWLWELTLLAGREGLGKSTIAYTLAAWITQGTMKGRFKGTPRDVLVAATEDSWDQTINPRLIAAGADLTRVHRVEVRSGDTPESLDLPVDIAQLKIAVSSVDAAMILLDPLLPRLSPRLDTHKDADVRKALEPLTAFVHEMQVSVLGIIHVNKSNSGDALNAVMGSRAFTAVARAVLMCAKNPEDGSCLFGLAKNNLGAKDRPSYPYQIVTARLGKDDEGDEVVTGRVEFGDKTSRSIDDVMLAISEGGMEGMSAVDEAAAWLKDYLNLVGGSKESKLVKSAGLQQGHNERTLKRAAGRLKVQYESAGFPAMTIWTLPAKLCQPVPSSGATSGDVL